MIEIATHPTLSILYVRFHDRGPIRWINADGVTGEQLRDPGLEPVDVDRDDEIVKAIDEAMAERTAEVLAALKGRKLGKVAREALAGVLECDPNEIGA